MIAAIITQSTVFGVTGGTTAGITTTGADLGIVALTYYKAAGANISDSKGNTWTQLTKYEASVNNAAVVIYYCSNPTVGTSHTFTTTSHFCGVNIAFFSGSRTATSPFDQETGREDSSGGSSVAVGSITPSVSSCVFVTLVMQNAAVGAPTIPSGYTSIGTYATGTAFAGGAAYKITTTAGAENPSWGVSTLANAMLDQADFMPPVVAATNSLLFLSFN